MATLTPEEWMKVMDESTPVSRSVSAFEREFLTLPPLPKTDPALLDKLARSIDVAALVDKFSGLGAAMTATAATSAATFKSDDFRKAAEAMKAADKKGAMDRALKREAELAAAAAAKRAEKQQKRDDVERQRVETLNFALAHAGAGSPLPLHGLPNCLLALQREGRRAAFRAHDVTGGLASMTVMRGGEMSNLEMLEELLHSTGFVTGHIHNRQDQAAALAGSWGAADHERFLAHCGVGAPTADEGDEDGTILTLDGTDDTLEALEVRGLEADDGITLDEVVADALRPVMAGSW